MPKVRTLSDVVDWRLCLGCGACAYICPERNVTLVNVLSEGIRPLVGRPEACRDCRACLDVCPGLGVDHRDLAARTGILPEAFSAFGPVLEIWEGYAADEEIRFKGSSGGALTALSLHCLEHEGMEGVLHIGPDPEDATRNSTRLSRSRQDLMACVGSRYAPASVCDRLDLVENAGAPCVIIGQPSEIAALRKAESIRPELAPKVGITMSFFCAGAPSREGTLELLKKLNVPADELTYMRYRGHGWPGMFATATRQSADVQEHMTYQDSWAFLQRFRSYATHLFPDGSGESADLSCGDPWYREIAPGEHGSSLIIVRTERGRRILDRAIKAGVIIAKPATAKNLAQSQANLTSKRGAVWGRLLAFRLAGAPAPRHVGFSLFASWRGLPFKEKQKSVLGTLRRILQRGYHRKRPPLSGDLHG